MSITDPNVSDRFTSAMEEIHNKELKTYTDIIDTTAELAQSHRQFVKSALGNFFYLFIFNDITTYTNICHKCYPVQLVFIMNILYFNRKKLHMDFLVFKTLYGPLLHHFCPLSFLTFLSSQLHYSIKANMSKKENTNYE